jgi:glycolate oxidase FAD binding subunit
VGSDSSVDTIVIAMEETAAAVAWQVGQLNAELPSELTRASSEFQGDLAIGLIRKWSDFPLATHRGLTFKASMLPAATASFFRRADAQTPRPALVAHAGNGIVFGHLPPETTLEQAAALLTALVRMAADAAGNVVVIRCPTAWKSVLPVWGRPTPDRVLMRAVKDKLDPRRVFNPGRFVDGL